MSHTSQDRIARLKEITERQGHAAMWSNGTRSPQDGADIAFLLAECARLSAALAEQTNLIERAWAFYEMAWAENAESRKDIEASPLINPNFTPLEMAFHLVWKRDPNVRAALERADRAEAALAEQEQERHDRSRRAFEDRARQIARTQELEAALAEQAEQAQQWARQIQSQLNDTAAALERAEKAEASLAAQAQELERLKTDLSSIGALAATRYDRWQKAETERARMDEIALKLDSENATLRSERDEARHHASVLSEAKQEIIDRQAQEIAELKAVAEDGGAVCICGCPLSEHDSYGEDGEQCERDDHECFRASKAAAAVVATLRTKLAAVRQERDALQVVQKLNADDVEWVVNDSAELGVKIGDQFFFCYKGHSLVYREGTHDDGRPMMWRPVFKREFGECIHPINYADPRMVGTVSLSDSDEWKPLPAPPVLSSADPE